MNVARFRLFLAKVVIKVRNMIMTTFAFLIASVPLFLGLVYGMITRLVVFISASFFVGYKTVAGEQPFTSIPYCVSFVVGRFIRTLRRGYADGRSDQ